MHAFNLNWTKILSFIVWLKSSTYSMVSRRITNLGECLRNLEKSTAGMPESMTMIQHMKTVLTFQFTEYKFFSVGDPRISYTSTPTIISACKERMIPEYHIFVGDDGSRMLEKVLPKFVDWKKCNLFYSVPVHQLPVLRTVASMHGAKILSDVRIDMYFLKHPQKLPHLSLKNDEIIKRLTGTDASIINYHWKYKNPESEANIRKTIEKGVGYGLFNKNQLVSWALLSGHGDMGFMYTLPEVRQRNYASMAVNKLCRHLLNLGITPIGFIELENEASTHLARRGPGYEKSIEATDVTFCPA